MVVKRVCHYGVAAEAAFDGRVRSLWENVSYQLVGANSTGFTQVCCIVIDASPLS
jgi:hypothetical protein